MGQGSHFPPAQRVFRSSVIFAVAVLLIGADATADTHSWHGGDGSWHQITHWTLEQVPFPGDDAFVSAASTTTVTYDALAPDYAAPLGTLQLNGSGGAVVTLNQSARTMRATNQYVGFDGAGIYNQTGGANIVGYALFLAYDPNSIGTYTISGSSTQLTTPWLLIANDTSATATFNHNGGTVSASILHVAGGNSAATGYYQFSGGTISAASGSLWVGQMGRGTFTQVGGVGTIGVVDIGKQSTGDGTLSLSGGSLNVVGITSIGSTSLAHGALNISGTGIYNSTGAAWIYQNGRVTQSGGQFNLSGNLNISGGYFTKTAGAFSLASGRQISITDGGTMSLSGASGPFTLPANTTLSVTNGRFSNTSYLDIATTGNGTLTVDGESASVVGGSYAYSYWGDGAGRAATISFLNGGVGSFTTIYLGRNSSTATLNVSGGASLTLNELIVGTLGGTGRVNLAAGTISASTVSLHGGGRIEQTGGDLQLSGDLLVKGGLYNKAGGLAIGAGHHIEVTNGGTIAITGSHVTAPGTGIAVSSGGRLTTTLYLDVGEFGVGTLLVDGVNSYVGTGSGDNCWGAGSGGAATVEFSSSAAGYVGPTYLGLDRGAGTLNVINGASLTTATLTAGTGGGTAAINLSGSSTLTTDSATIGGAGALSGVARADVTGGTFNVGGHLTIGPSGTLDVSSSGNVSVTNGPLQVLTPSGVYIGKGSGQGTVTLLGSLHSDSSVRVGWDGSGTLLHQGGLLDVGAATLYVGAHQQAQAFYELSGAGNILANHESIALYGSGSFTQQNGWNAIANHLTIGANANAHGLYTLNGGTLSAGSAYIGGGTLAAAGYGTIIVNGGTFNVTGPLTVWNTGTANLAGGWLHASQLTVDGGTMNNAGGRVSVCIGTPSALPGPGFYVGNGSGAGDVFLSGTLLEKGSAYVGWDGPGTILNTGVHSIAGALTLGQLASSSGTYSLASGNARLEVGGHEYVGYQGAARFIQSTGTHTIGGNLYVGYFASGSGTFDLSSGGLDIGGNLYIGDLGGFGGHGTMNDSGGRCIVSGGQLTILDNGTLDITGADRMLISTAPAPATGYYGLNVGENGIGSVTLRGYLRSDGTAIGYNGAGTFFHLAGTHDLDSSSLQLRAGASGSAYYRLDSGTLLAMQETIGLISEPNAVFDQFGGTNIVDTIFVDSLYNLNGGTFNSTNFADMHGRFNYNAGIFTANYLHICLGGELVLMPGGDKVLQARGFGISGDDPFLDLADNRMIVDYESLGAFLDELLGYLNDGSVMSSSTEPGMMLGYADNTTLQLSSFGGVTFPSGDYSQVLIGYILAGDTNFDGKVNTIDFNNLAGAFGNGWNNYWVNGDCNYDGDVDSIDFNQLVANYGRSTIGLSALASVAPEPAMLGFAAIFALMLRRRKSG